jgi:hypothetical protein
MKHKRAYNDKGCKSIRTGILDCFAALAMTNEREGQRDEMANGRKENNAYLFIRSLVYSFTDYTTLSSLRGTKQSRTMKHKRIYNDKSWKAIREGDTGLLRCARNDDVRDFLDALFHITSSQFIYNKSLTSLKKLFPFAFIAD